MFAAAPEPAFSESRQTPVPSPDAVWPAVKRYLLRAAITVGITAAPAAVFIVVNLGQPLNPFMVAVAVSALIDVGYEYGAAYFILDTMICWLVRWRRTRVGLRLAVVCIFAACSIYIGALTRIA
jgi:hypothetical protein